LQPGDQILSIGNESFAEIEHDKAREIVLKQPPGTVRGICILLIIVFILTWNKKKI